MKLSALFWLNAVLATAFGLAFLAVPGALLQNYGIEGLTLGNAEVARLFGATLITIGVLTFLSRESVIATSPAVTALIIGNTIGTVVSLHGTLTGATNALGWSTVAIYALFGAGYAYCRFAQQPAAAGAH